MSIAIPTAVISFATMASATVVPVEAPIDVAVSKGHEAPAELPAASVFTSHEMTSYNPFGQEVALSEHILSQARGGFEVAGIDIEVGLTLQLVDGSVHSFVTNPTAFVQALSDLGFSDQAAAHQNISNTFDSEGLTTIVMNTLDNVTLSQNVTIDITAANLQQAIGIASVHSLAATQITPVYLTGF